MTFWHWAGVSPYTARFRLAETCVFVKQSPEPGLCPHAQRVGPLLPKLRGQLAEFLHEGSLARLSLLSSPTCVGLRYGLRHAPRWLFLAPPDSPRAQDVLSTGVGAPGDASPTFQHMPQVRTINRCSIAYATWPRLRSRLTLGGRTCPRNP